MTTETKSIKEVLLDWLDEARSEGISLHEAAEKAIERVVGTNMAAEAFRALGPDTIVYFWRRERGYERRDQITPGRRRFDNRALHSTEALWDVLVHVEGVVWKPFGDLVKNECRLIASNYLKREVGNRKWRLFYERVEAALQHSEQSIQSALTPEQVRSLFAETGVVEAELSS